ncbi:MAG: DUF4294 domain-containing protein [Chitinophagaceae bacterium]|nr:DUF4294 domain-containing protein [Chitinophagaceae bacterium]
MPHFKLIVIFCLLLFLPFLTWAQNKASGNDTIMVGAIVVGSDTMPHKWLKEVYVTEKASKDLAKMRRKKREQDEAYSRLRYNVYYVYPYAVSAAFILKDIDSVLVSLHSKEAKQQFKRRKENELNKQFKGELENMTIDQGHILVKLIARQTGKPCYTIVKDLKGGFNARIWQTVAFLFSHNLKDEYDAQGEDADIETFVQEIEARGHFERVKS